MRIKTDVRPPLQSYGFAFGIVSRQRRARGGNGTTTCEGNSKKIRVPSARRPDSEIHVIDPDISVAPNLASVAAVPEIGCVGDPTHFQRFVEEASCSENFS